LERKYSFHPHRYHRFFEIKHKVLQDEDTDSSSDEELELETHTGAWTKKMKPNEEEHEDLCDGEKNEVEPDQRLPVDPEVLKLKFLMGES